MPLRQHLRADEDVDPVGGDLRAHRFERAARARRVAVDARDARVREHGGQRRLEPLRPETPRQQVDVAARRARTGAAVRVAAMMQRRRAGARRTTRRALQRGQPASQAHAVHLSDGA
jgi:hypothetical protein